jgi:hypothetical protein
MVPALFASLASAAAVIAGHVVTTPMPLPEKIGSDAAMFATVSLIILRLFFPVELREIAVRLPAGGSLVKLFRL